MMVARSKKKKKPKLSAAEIALATLQREHKKLIRTTFSNAGFRRISELADKAFVFEGQMGDLDDFFIYENVIVALEYTVKSGDIGEHLKPKKILFDKILGNPTGFLDLLTEKFPDASPKLSTGYHKSQIILKILYCSRYPVEEKYKLNVPGPIYFDYPEVRYFSAVSSTIKNSVRYEIFEFLDIPITKIGKEGTIKVGASLIGYEGSILPEAHSHFKNGYKIVTFYADPETLLRLCYVLRKDGWRDSSSLYQRMISSQKIKSIRDYLRDNKRVFINNIIVTLPSGVKPLSHDGNTIDVSKLTETAPVKIMIPDVANSVGIIDGQHRVFAYHETRDDDEQIAELRKQQNLLITGIIYPEGITRREIEKFEARLFLEINSTQATAKADLKQAIGMVLKPFAPESIATRVLTNLSRKGPLAGFVEQYFYETDKLKTSSIVSYGLKPLVKTSGADSLFAVWENDEKDRVAEGKNLAALEQYAEFCVEKISAILLAFKKNINSSRWTTDTKIESRVLTTTYINSFLIVLRLLIKNEVTLSSTNLEKKLQGIEDFDFSVFHSSQYKRMAEAIVAKHFNISE